MSLRDIRVLGIGRPLNKALADMALPYLKMLIDAWAADGRTIYRVRRKIFDLQTGRNAYSIGPGGDFDIRLRPRWIASANTVRDIEQFEYPVTFWTRTQWLNEAQKELTYDRPRAIYLELGAGEGNDTVTNAALSTVYLWPLPAQPSSYPVKAERSDRLGGDIQEQEAIQNSELAAVHDRPEPPRRVLEEIGKGHLPTGDKSDVRDEQAERDQGSAKEFDHAGSTAERQQLRPVSIEHTE